MMKGDFAVVDYVGYESTYSDILSLDNVRHTNAKYVRCFLRFLLFVCLTVCLLTGKLSQYITNHLSE